MTQMKSILTVVFLLAVAIGLMMPWIFSQQLKVHTTEPMPPDTLMHQLPQQNAVSEKNHQQNSTIVNTFNKEALSDDQSLEIKQLLNYCNNAQEPLCVWTKALSENSNQYPGRSAILTWLAHKWQALQSSEERIALETQMMQALLAEEEALESYQKSVQEFLDQDLANSSLEELKARMQSMDQQILAMKLQGMTEAETELLRLRLRAAHN